MRQLKIPQAWGSTGKTFYPIEIEQPDRLATMQSQTLWDADFQEVFPVHCKGKKRSHFKAKNELLDADIESAERADNDPTHNDAVDSIQQGLTSPKAQSIEVLIKCKPGSKSSSRSVWKSHPSSHYHWFKEPATRLDIDPAHFVQPDVVGTDSTRMSRSKKNPCIVIEVVRTHWPESETFKSLEQLSRMNTLILFYFVKKNLHRNSFVNKANLASAQKAITVSSYLHNGIFYLNDCAVETDPKLTMDERYIFIKNAAVADAEKKFKDQIKKKT